MDYKVQRGTFLEGQRINEPLFAGPSFSLGPQPPQLSIPPPRPVTPPPVTVHHAPLLPPRPTSKPPAPPQGEPPDTHITTVRIMRDTGHISTTGTTKTWIQLLKQAKTKFDTFLDKYCFGTVKKLIDVLPQVKETIPVHRDQNFTQGEIQLARYHRELR